MNRLLQDSPFALRQLRKTPGFTLTVVFSVMNAVLIQLLPVYSSEGGLLRT